MTQGRGLSTLRFIDPHLDEDLPRTRVPATAPRPLPTRLRALDVTVAGAGTTYDLDGWLAATYTTSLLVVDNDTVVHEWYAEDLGAHTAFLGASMTKSVLATLVGLAVGEGRLRTQDRVVDHVPELAGSGYAACRVFDVLTMTSGTDWVEDHRDPHGLAARLVQCFAGDGESSRRLLTEVGSGSPPGARWEYSTADSQVLDWVRERATGQPYSVALAELAARLGTTEELSCAHDAHGVALAGGGLAATSRDWARFGLLALTGTAPDGARLLSADWLAGQARPAYAFTEPGRLPSTITAHAGFGSHWWPTDRAARCFTADGSRGQFCYVDTETEIVVVKTSLWPYADSWVDRQCRDLSYLGLPAVAASATCARPDPEPKETDP